MYYVARKRTRKRKRRGMYVPDKEIEMLAQSIYPRVHWYRNWWECWLHGIGMGGGLYTYTST